MYVCRNGRFGAPHALNLFFYTSRWHGKKPFRPNIADLPQNFSPWWKNKMASAMSLGFSISMIFPHDSWPIIHSSQVCISAQYSVILFFLSLTYISTICDKSQQKVPYVYFERFKIFALSKKQLNKLSNDTKLIKIKQLLLKYKKRLCYFSYYFPYILQTILPNISK